jgi:hypothetical protein
MRIGAGSVIHDHDTVVVAGVNPRIDGDRTRRPRPSSAATSQAPVRSSAIA